MANKPCIFCQVVSGELPSTREYEDDELLAFHDIYPKAETHLIVIPKAHIADFSEVPGEMELFARMSKVAKDLIAKHNLSEKGYRLVVNGAGAALIPHLHLHILGGVPHEREL